jgi:hypothetical protein
MEGEGMRRNEKEEWRKWMEETRQRTNRTSKAKQKEFYCKRS